MDKSFIVNSISLKQEFDGDKKMHPNIHTCTLFKQSKHQTDP